MHCPTCKQPIDAEKMADWLPFCSRRCQLIDLGDWLSERHRIPQEEPDDFNSGSEEPDDHTH